MQLSPLTARRLQIFRANRRGWWSMWIFLFLFIVSLFAEFVANDKPLLVYYKDALYWPIFSPYPETTFGGDFQTKADYGEPYVSELIEKDGWMLWPPIRYHHRTVAWDLRGPAPSPPSVHHLIGTDDQARDVLARVIYGFRISVLFGFTLTIFSAVIGVSAAAVQGYFGGWIDLLFQRFIEVWSSIPLLYLIIILASVGFTAVGTVFAAMLSSIRTREVLLPILLFPIIIPIILAAVNGTQEILILEEAQFLDRWLQLLIAFDVIFVAAGFLLFEYVVAD